MSSLPSRQASASEQQLRKAYLKRAYEDGYQDGDNGKLRASASYFTREDHEAIAQYRYGLRIGRRERARRERGRA